jgi:hypothetical protein
MKFFRHQREANEKISAAEELIDAKRDQLKAQTPRVNILVAWLEQRKLYNGFGQDFELTLAHPRD